MAPAGPGDCSCCRADAGKRSRSARDQAATTKPVGGGAAGRLSGLCGQRVLVLRWSVAGTGDHQAATGMAFGGVAARVGGERLAGTTEAVVWVWAGDGSVAGWLGGHLAWLVADVRPGSWAISSLHPKPVGAGSTCSVGVFGKDPGSSCGASVCRSEER